VPFEAAPFGVTGLETAFAVLYSELVEPGHLPLQTLLARLSAGPARIFGLDRPRIAAGVSANVVLLDLAGVTRVTEQGFFRSRSANSWLLGRSLKGRVAMTVANGAVVHE
jgi:dihydroorotase